MPADPSDAVTDAMLPADEAGVAAAILAARERGEPLLVTGAGTKSAMLRPVQAARSLSTRALSGVTLYAPKELVISALAGTPVTEIESVLAGSGQYLVPEPPDFAALLGTPAGAPTLGGVVAANLSGPRRVAWGAMRDHLMGVRAVNGAGEIIHSGGRVLKNVTGLDLCKLLAGSHGTLGVITEITMKVLPAPERVGTLVLPGLAVGPAVEALSAALGSPYGVSGAAWLPAEAAARVPELAWARQPVTLVRLEDFATSVVYRGDRLRRELAAFGAAELIDDGASRSLWRAVRDVGPLANDAGEAIWRVSVRPSAGPGIIAAADAAGGRGFLDWGGGLAWIAAPATAAAHAALSGAATRASGVWTVMRAPDALRTAIDVVPPEAPALAALTRRVKAAMDPAGILNPGRIYGGG